MSELHYTVELTSGERFTGAVHDDVVDEHDVEETAGADEPRREEPVFVRRPNVAGRVVARGDEADGAAHDGVAPLP